jgi:hypothetical protein
MNAFYKNFQNVEQNAEQNISNKKSFRKLQTKKLYGKTSKNIVIGLYLIS